MKGNRALRAQREVERIGRKEIIRRRDEFMTRMIMEKERLMKTYDKLLLDGAPPGVIFVVCERMELTAGYVCYYAVAKDPEKPRGRYDWRMGLIDYEKFARGKDPEVFWETQPKEFKFTSSAEPQEANLWVEKQHGKFEALETLLEYAGLLQEFYDRCFDFYAWDRDWGVFTLLPEEIEGRPKIALELLKERAVTQGGEIDAKA